MSTTADRLKRYNEKRDFAKTAEPQGEAGPARQSRLSFLVQKHAARRLHYDFRLEWDGVLLSWAVTKGPSDDPGEKRLAVRTEDHPLSYADFEGTIPEGEYGGGSVMLWDRGTWEPLHDPDRGLKEGKLHFRLNGERLRGGWALVRMRGKGKRENWLLIKERDETAGDDPDRLTQTFATSVKTGRAMEEIAEGDDPEPSEQDGKRPRFAKPQLATLSDEAPQGDAWWHETKFDGYRCLVALGKGGPRFYTRSGKDWSDAFAGLAPAFRALACQAALIDGEVMARDIQGSAFSSLQAALSEGGPLVFYAFDLLHLDGEDLTGKPLRVRREALERLTSGQGDDGPLRLTDYVTGHGPMVFEAACKEGAEGIVSKRIEAPYRHTRSRDWLKVKCTHRQEFVIGGYAPSDKKGRAFASLYLGEYDGERLVYRGRVGTGFKERDFQRIAKAMTRRKTAPFAAVPKEVAREAVWLRPDLVAEIDYADLTRDGYVRHAAFLGLRADKTAKEVTMGHETAIEDGDEAGGEEARVLGVRISNPGREIYPSAGLTKLDLARYYEAVGERMARIVDHRPLSLVRCPTGLEKACFFQKHPGKGFPGKVPRIDIEESDGKTGEYLYVTRPEMLVTAVQMGALEFHIWGARSDRLERPDRLVFDLDPDQGLDWKDVRTAAFAVRDRLADLGLASGALVTGGKGVHVWLPLRRTRTWDTVKLFAKTFAYAMAEAEPERYVAQMSKAKRKGRIFIDWLRNERGSTAIAPYSARARQGAPAARPVTWEELKTLKAASAFTVAGVSDWLADDCPYLAMQEDLQTLTNDTVDALEAFASGT